MAAATILVLGIPWLAHQLSPTREFARQDLGKAVTAHAVFGGQRMTGFMVVADDTPLPENVPTMHFSTFVEIFKNSDLDELYVGLLNSRSPTVSFALVASARIENGATSNYQYVVPPEVLERRDVIAWQLEGQDRNPNSEGRWFDVTRAEPLGEVARWSPNHAEDTRAVRLRANNAAKSIF